MLCVSVYTYFILYCGTIVIQYVNVGIILKSGKCLRKRFNDEKMYRFSGWAGLVDTALSEQAWRPDSHPRNLVKLDAVAACM